MVVVDGDGSERWWYCSWRWKLGKIFWIMVVIVMIGGGGSS